MKKNSYLESVRNQYESYPYPARDPDDEKGFMFTSSVSSLDCINHFCFEGARDFNKPFRVLIPGGGTGDCTIFLAEQLRNTKAEIIYLDICKASMAIAKDRAKIRGLKNITWIHDSILNLPSMDLGLFDYITCSGVLHHMADPQAGLDALKSVLHPKGAIALMVYAQYGRSGIYQMQELLRRIHVNEDDPQKKVSNTRALLKGLPEGNWYNFNSGLWDLELKTDIGLYDLLLHPQDRAYTVPELYEYVEKSGLLMQKLLNLDNGLGDMLFQPETFIRDPGMLENIKKMSFREQAAICELMFGQLMRQSCYISFVERKVPSVDDLSLIPSIAVTVSGEESGKALNDIFLSKSKSIRINRFISFNRTAHAADIFRAINGKRTAKEVIAFAQKKSNVNASLEQVESEYKTMANILTKVFLLFLRAPKLPPYETLVNVESRMHKLHGKKQCLKALESYKSKNKS